MRTFLKIFGTLVVLFVIMVIAGIIYLFNSRPDVGPSQDITVESTPPMVARGEYIASHVSLCIGCHSERDWTKFAGPIKPGSHGQGGDFFSAERNVPGKLIAPNITPYNLDEWSDGDIYRVVTTGVTKDNKALFPLMHYMSYSHMAHEDILSVIAFLRTLTPIETNHSESELSFPTNFMVNTIPQKAKRASMPDTSNMLDYGRYVTTIAGCTDCHTSAEQEGMSFAGGLEFPLPTGIVVRSSNITPDTETGIGAWDEKLFVEKFKSFDNPENASTVAKGEFNSVMPWYEYSGITEKDLSAIFAYLQTLKPVKNLVIKFTPQ